MTPKQVKAIRLKLGLTQVQFAKQLNYTQANISKWESGAIKLGPRAEKLIEFAAQYGDAKAMVQRWDDDNMRKIYDNIKGENQ